MLGQQVLKERRLAGFCYAAKRKAHEATDGLVVHVRGYFARRTERLIRDRQRSSGDSILGERPGDASRGLCARMARQ